MDKPNILEMKQVLLTEWKNLQVSTFLLFFFYLMALSIYWIVQNQIMEWLVNNELENI